MLHGATVRGCDDAKVRRPDRPSAACEDTSRTAMHTLRPFAAAFILCGAIVVAASARQVAPARQSRAVEPSPSSEVASDARSPRNANYEIDARLDDAAKSIRGRETIRWR